ncbi:MAG TPA: non-homologous end-joining DNA ligase [Lacunisphaera sp.]|jgi:bifunctional non-homologous end joining protein LigD|nr:non-homologous end-joining DNA ligase [Lacunisphaera sp.]
MSRASSTLLRIGKQEIEVSHLDKVLYPETGFTKGDVIHYYIDIAPVLLPHLAGRALTMKRYPDGVGRFFFYEKNCPAHRPRWLPTVAVTSTRSQRTIRYCVVDTLPALVWAANLADLELHVSLARAATAPARPTVMVFDLDPGPGAGLLECARVAMKIRARLADRSLGSFPKTSGSKGLQVYVPLNTPATFGATKAISRALAEELAAELPNDVTANMRKDLRGGKVFIDWSQNDTHKTTVCAYSLRATPEPSVSTPLAWAEVEGAVRTKKADRLRFGPKEVLARVARRGDLFAPVLRLKQKLPSRRMPASPVESDRIATGNSRRRM